MLGLALIVTLASTAPVEPESAAPAPTTATQAEAPAATSPHPHTDYPRRRPNWGGWGHASGGVLIGDWGGYRGALTHPSGVTLPPARTALQVGGGGAMLLAGRYVIGGKGFGLFTPRATTGWGQVALSGGGGGFDVGVVVVNTRRWLVFPKFGMGGLGHTMTVRNESDEDVAFGTDGATIAANSEDTYGSGYFTAEVGVGFKRLTFPRQEGGGLINGGEIGVMMSITDSGWNQNDVIVSGVPPFRMVALYLRLDIGGGGFWWGEFGGRRAKTKRQG